MRFRTLVCVLLLAACAPTTARQAQEAKTLQPYFTLTPSPTAGALVGPTTAGGTPPASPTPSLYTIQSGDTLSQIAEKLHVALDALLAANPDIDPNAMPVGHALKIPGPQDNLVAAGSPTPVTFPVDPMTCHATSDGGLWCFALVHNEGGELIEDVTALVTLSDAAGNPIASRTGVLPLDIVPANQSLPIAVFFPPGVPADAKPQVRILTAIRVPATDPRYLAAAVKDTSIQLDWSGLSAEVTGEITLPAQSRSASAVWLAAVAHDAAGNVIGVRRWESNVGLAGGGSLPFSLMIASVAGQIERVEFSVETRP